MFRKTGAAIIAVSLASFAIGVVGEIVAQFGPEPAVAWSQDSTQVANDAAPGDSADNFLESEPDQKSTPPNVGGAWCGSLEDNQLGSGTISMNVLQKGSKIHGSWTDDLGASGTFKGKVQGNAVVVTLKPRGTNCRYHVNGTLVTPTEISGNYSVFGCHIADGGNFDINSGC
jgi:hypothetical protein